MTMPAGIAPRTIQGEVVQAQPGTVIDPRSAGVHALMTVLHRLVQYSGAYHSESEVDAALNALSAFEKAHVTSAVLSALNEEAPLPAAREDVTKRIPPNAAAPQPLVAQGAVIDYNKLAAALVAAQAAAAAAQQEVPSQ